MTSKILALILLLTISSVPIAAQRGEAPCWSNCTSSQRPPSGIAPSGPVVRPPRPTLSVADWAAIFRAWLAGIVRPAADLLAP